MGSSLAKAALAFTGLYTLVFSPTILAGRLLAPGDSILQSVPGLYARLDLWTPLLFSGFPVAGDPQTMTWYPLAWIFSWGLTSWNVFVIAGYVLASTLTYGYVWSLTTSRLAAAVSGVVFGSCGLLMSALSHPHVIHSAAWLPLMVWSLRELQTRVRREWIALLAVSVALSALAGHPQTFIYALGLVVVYAFFTAWSAPATGRKPYVAASGTGIVLGLGMASILFLPLAELVPRSLRADASFEFFTTGSLSPFEIPGLLFPFGVNIVSGIPKAVYAGVFALLLAGLGVLTSPSRRLVGFWVAVAVISFLLALGASTPLARLMYAIPGFNAFQAPVRHFLEFSFAIAVLAGLALPGLRASRPEVRQRLLGRCVWVGLTVLVLAAILLVLTGPGNSSVSTRFAGLMSPSTLFQLAVLGMGVVCLLAWGRRPTSFRGGLVALVIVLDLTFAGGLGNQEGLPALEDVSTPASLDRYREQLQETGQRLSPLDGLSAPTGAGQPNMSWLWEIPSASGYSPLIMSRYSEFLAMRYTGQIAEHVLGPADRAVDLLGVRYLTAAVPHSLIEPISSNDGWPLEDMNRTLGGGCGGDRTHVLEFPLSGIQVSRIGVVTAMACSEGVPDGTEVMRITLTGSEGGPREAISVRAGIHTAEWAWERPDVRPIVVHQRAPVFASRTIEDEQGALFDRHQYVATLPVNTTVPLTHMRLEWVGPSGDITIDKLVLEDRRGEPYAIGFADTMLADSPRWRYLEHLGSTPLFENLRAMPRVWLTSDVMSMEAADILRAVRESTLPSGVPFDPHEVALVEGPIGFDRTTPDDGRTASVVELLPGQVTIDVETDARAFLVLADTYYPGWVASVDGVPTEVFRTNYVLRGVVVEPGEHSVVFTYRPIMFYIGAAISLAAFGAILVILSPGTLVRT